MQYPVPQFTDVEDKIIGSLTIKQFGIVFAAGIFIFLIYSATKSLVITIFFLFIIGLPALGLAFVKYNGRALYNTLPIIAKFVMGPKVLVFHKESTSFSAGKFKSAELSSEKKEAVAAPEEEVDPEERLKEVNRILQEQAAKEREMVQKLKV